MSEEDRRWLEKAMEEYTFNDTDRLKEIITKLKEWAAIAKGQTDEPAENQAAASGN